MYITTREMVISIICNACGVLGLILWAIEAHKSNADNASQDVESVGSVDRKTEPQTITAEEKAELLDALGGGEFFPKDEPKTDCEGCDRYEDGGELCDMCALEKGKEDAQTESKTTGTDCSWK